MLLKPEYYDVEVVKLKDVKLIDYGKSKILNIHTVVDCLHQGYPMCKIPDINLGVQYLLDCFEVNKLEDVNGKKALKVAYDCDIFCLVNSNNNKTFSLLAKYFPEQYIESIAIFREKKGNDFLKKLSLEDVLIVGFLNEIKVSNNGLSEEVKRIVNSYSLYNVLENELSQKGDRETKKRKL